MNFSSTCLLAAGAALTVSLCSMSAEVRADEPLTVAVLGFSAPDSEHNHVGQMINDTVEVLLSGEEGFALVNRSEMASTLSEQGMNLAGVVDASQATQVGHVVGAQLLVTGKAFELGESRIITAKLIGTETTRVKAVMAKGELDQPIDALVFEVAEQLAAVMRESGSELVASSQPTDPLPALIEQLAGRELPTFAIVIPEEHRQVRVAAPGPVPDPAVETELKIILLQAGVRVQDVQDNALADWVNRFEEGDNSTWPRTLEGVDMVIIGEAFSESGGTLGQLRLASARAEINVIARKDGQIVFADRATTRGVDLAEEIAGKTALEKAGRIFAINLLTYLEANSEAP